MNQAATAKRGFFNTHDRVASGVAIMLVLLGGMMTFLVLRPAVGIDDANITQVYAISFAERFEFTYYAGGERVEGSTSFLWTLINGVLFALPGPAELWVTLICFGLSVLTISNCWKLGFTSFLDNANGPSPLYSVLFALLFLTFLGFFAWSLWALMDITLWLCLLSAILLFTVRQLKNGSPPQSSRSFILFAAAFALLTVTRPEGVAISLGILLYVLIHSTLEKQKHASIQYLIAIGLVVATFAAVTFWRLSYFGVPFPNTFYAKVSTNSVEQALSGLSYLRTFLMSDFILPLLLGFVVSAGLTINFRQTLFKLVFDHRVFQFLFVLGIITLYTMLGGDHFGSYRFFQPVLLVILPFVAGTMTLKLSSKIQDMRSTLGMVISIIGLACVTISSINFMQDNGDLAKEFRIAEDGRLLGERLNQLSPGTSISVVPAGGIAVTYRQGPIYDLMGLNWTVMAHASDDLSGTVKNHGGFVEEVFWEAAPDIVTPANWDCSDLSGYPDAFWWTTLKGLYGTERFKADYETVCAGSVAMFVRKNVAARVTAEMSEP
ncbi:MAG: hypothetical protein AAGK66_07425 [Pseudomonadota bacterium]